MFNSSHQSNMNILSVSALLFITTSLVQANHGRLRQFLSAHRRYQEESSVNVNSHNKHLNDQANSSFPMMKVTRHVRRQKPCYKISGNVFKQIKSECKPDSKMLRTIRRCAKTSFTSTLCRQFSVDTFKNLSSKNLFY